MIVCFVRLGLVIVRGGRLRGGGLGWDGEGGYGGGGGYLLLFSTE